MKDIKFRAFHKPSKKLFDVYCFTDIEVMENSFDGVFTSETLPALRQDCELMQYTGLKDSTQFNELTKEEQEDWLKDNKIEDWKGKEIFEGDVVEGYINIFSTDFAGNDRYGKTLKKGYVYYDLETPSFNINFDDSIDFLNEFENIKILGNIHQNSELSEIKK